MLLGRGGRSKMDRSPCYLSQWSLQLCVNARREPLLDISISIDLDGVCERENDDDVTRTTSLCPIRLMANMTRVHL